jgi:glycosyltransferase involved in cell wall biosynthesis
VHVNGYVHAALDWDLPVVVVAHSDVLSWFEAVRGQAAPPEWDRYRREVARGLAAADLVVAPTHAMLAALERHHRVDAPTCVIHNGVSPGPPPRPKRELVLAAGRMWDEAKNIAVLRRVSDRIRVEIADWIGRRGLRARMAEAAVFCAPARYEPFGLGPLEAALAGCALVLGDIPSLREVWGDAALYVDPDDDEALAAALQRALRERRDASARAARYSAPRMAARYVDAYRGLVAA